MSRRLLRVLTVIGTRPEAIKLAPVIKEFERQPDRFASRVCVTGQHRQMLDQALASFEVRPDLDLGIMGAGQSLADITARAVQGLDREIAREHPDVVVVQGDTTTTLCGALAAFYHRVPVAQVEAGLRTNDRYSPFPEELNRRLTTQLADVHFAPTEHARAALLAEGVDPAAIHVTGNTVIDALLLVRDRIRKDAPELPAEVMRFIDGHRVVLVTGHRRESFGAAFGHICEAIRQVADQVSDVRFVYPVHLNPNVREPVKRILGGHARILLVEPMSYVPFVWLMDRSEIVLTDSGGVQEEAPSLGKPVLVMRTKTERPEGIAAGNARLVGTDRQRISDTLLLLLRDPDERKRMTAVTNPYGDGHASERIARILATTIAPA